MEQKSIDTLIAKDDIRDLALLYCRGCDRRDFDMIRGLYTTDAMEYHDETFTGPAQEYVDFLAKSLPYARYSGHHVCNHLISVDIERGEGEGEIYAVAWHIIPDRDGGWIEDLMCCRYIDRYRREADGRWRFAQRVVTYDMRTAQPYAPSRAVIDPTADPSYKTLSSRIFARMTHP